MARKKETGLTLEAQEIVSDLRARVEEAMRQAEELAVQESAFLAKADAAKATIPTIRAAADGLVSQIEEIRACAAILGLGEEVDLALELVAGEADTKVGLAESAAADYVAKAEGVWASEDEERSAQLQLFHRLVLARREAKNEADRLAARAKADAITEAQAVLEAVVTDQAQLERLIGMYGKRHGEARRGEFPADPNDASSIRNEMLRRVLRGANFKPDIVAEVDLEDAERVFMIAQTEAHKNREVAGDAGVDQEATSTVRDTVFRLGLGPDQFNLVVTNGSPQMIRGELKGKPVNRKFTGGWENTLSRMIA